LCISEPARPDQHNHGLGGADGLFQRANPRQTRRQITAVKEGLQALVTQDRIDLRRVAPVPTNPVVASLLAENRAI